MILRLKADGYLTLVQTEVHFTPFTLLLGRNGSGKTALLSALDRASRIAWGGPDQAFGPPPFSLGFLRTRGQGDIAATAFEIDVETTERFRYTIQMREHPRNGLEVREERLIRMRDLTQIATRKKGSSASETILRPDPPIPGGQVESVAGVLRSWHVHDLDPRQIERPSDPQQANIGRFGAGVGSYLARLAAEEPDRATHLNELLREMRPGTKVLRTWSGAEGQIYWGIEEEHESAWRYPAALLSWGDRALVGLLCALFDAPKGSILGLEEIDRGFHPSRYESVVDLLSRAVDEGVGAGPLQIVATSHSPALVSKFHDRLDELRLVQRVAGGGTVVRSVAEALKEKLGTDRTEAPIGEVWSMGLLDDATPAPS